MDQAPDGNRAKVFFMFNVKVTNKIASISFPMVVEDNTTAKYPDVNYNSLESGVSKPYYTSYTCSKPVLLHTIHDKQKQFTIVPRALNARVRVGIEIKIVPIFFASYPRLFSFKEMGICISSSRLRPRIAYASLTTSFATVKKNCNITTNLKKERVV